MPLLSQTDLSELRDRQKSAALIPTFCQHCSAQIWPNYCRECDDHFTDGHYNNCIDVTDHQRLNHRRY